MFNQQELQILLGGVNSPIDLIDLREHTQYGGLFNDHEATIEMFWRVRTCSSFGYPLPRIQVSCRSSTRSIRINDDCC